LINIFLDDIRPCQEGFVLACNATECPVLLRNNKVNTFSSDYDLRVSDAFTMPNE